MRGARECCVRIVFVCDSPSLHWNARNLHSSAEKTFGADMIHRHPIMTQMSHTDNPELLVEIEVYPNPNHRWHGLVQCDDDADLLEKNIEPLSLAF